jgi:hypothetical protein
MVEINFDVNEININNIIVNAKDYSFSTDKRLLIPFTSNSKIGFLDNNREIVIPPKYDDIQGHCYSKDDLIKVGVLYSYNFGKDKNYVRYLYGLIDCKGNTIMHPEYYTILVSNDKKVITAQNKKCQYLVLDRSGNLIIEPRVYNWIDKFDHNMARVIKAINNEKKWGIINSAGEIILPIEYDNIYNFCDKGRESTLVFKDGESYTLHFSKINNLFKKEDKIKFTRYKETYEEYSGSYAQDYEGWSDQDIDDVFEGDPDAYWNID